MSNPAHSTLLRHSTSSPALALLTVAAFLLVSPAFLQAQICTSTIGTPQFGGTIAVHGFGLSSSTLTNAFGYWSSCPGYGTSQPQLVVANPNQSYNLNVNVFFNSGSNPTQQQCGSATFMSNGTSTVTLWGSIQVPGVGQVSCAPHDETLAHELGHSLGLGNSTCTDYLMGPRHYNASTGTWIPRSPAQPSECTAVNENWTTPEEGGGGPGGGLPGDQEDGSPILIDLDRDLFHLTGLGDPVFFDIDADGELEVLSWTSAETLDAFLWLDRNDNGIVDDGAELFGNHTPLIDGSTADNGYIPLAEFDLPALGGNGNGRIDSGDVIHPELRLWIDRNHNGVSEPDEILGLADAGVTRIGLAYLTTPFRDHHGNYFRYVSLARILVDGQERFTFTTDVFFVVAE